MSDLFFQFFQQLYLIHLLPRKSWNFPAEGRTFLRTLRNSKPCVYVFFDGFCHGICFSTSKQLLALKMSKIQSYWANVLICIWEGIRLSFPPYVFEMFAALFMKHSLNPIYWILHWVIEGRRSCLVGLKINKPFILPVFLNRIYLDPIDSFWEFRTCKYASRAKEAENTSKSGKNGNWI